MLDLNISKLLILGVLALLIFGPDRLPGMAAQAGRALRELRRMADGAKSELQENLGPEFSNFDLADLNPRHFVRKHLVDEITGDGLFLGAAAANDGATNGGAANGGASGGGGAGFEPQRSMAVLSPGEWPPYDAEAT